MRYLPVDKSQIPVTMSLIVEGTQYDITFNYNALYDFFTVTLELNGNQLVEGEKLCLDRPLFTTAKNPFEKIMLVPMDISGQAKKITFENFGTSVFIWWFEFDDNGEIVVDEDE